MRENDFQRRRREREFQERILATLIKLAPPAQPKRSRFLALINSAFFLWLASTVVVVMGGSYITNHLQCLRDARQIIDHRQAVLLELRSRSMALLDTIGSAQTPQQLFVADGTRGKGNDALSKMSYVDLLMDYTNTLTQVDQDELPYPDIEKDKFNWIEFSSKAADGEFERAIRRLNDEYFYGPRLAEYNFNHRKLSNLFDLTVQNFEYDTDFSSYYTEPNCSIVNLALMTAGYSPPIVHATYNNIFDVPAEFQKTKSKLDDLRAAIEGKDTIPKPH